jgi:tetratricopeptide (TPR) repeat protein
VSNHQEVGPEAKSEGSPDRGRGLVHEGWEHLELQRPLAAWASWQRALRIDPGGAAAREALERLANAAELPPAARAVYRFQSPADESQRTRWDARLRGQGLDDLAGAAEAFAALTVDEPSDAAAWYNLALCRAWLGQNTEAVACLDRAVGLLAVPDPARATDAWTLAEVLRQGAGAESLADDVRFALVADRPSGEGFPDWLFDRWPGLVPLAMPSDPITGAPRIEDGQVYEWLDRPPGAVPAKPREAAELPQVLATVIRTPRQVRVSSPDPSGLALLDEPAFAQVGRALAAGRREKSPLPIAWADAALGTFRLPTGLDAAETVTLARLVVEHYFEDIWVRQPRQALGGLSPLAAGRAAARGDAVARAKLAAVIRYREQLGSRPSHAAVYQGYPFDRLRRRVGLPDADPAAFEADDPSCMSERELDDLDPGALDASRLRDAFLSAAALGDDARTARFAAALARLDPPARSRLDPAAVFAPLVREALRLGEPDEALDWLATAKSTSTGSEARTFAVWSAEIQARTGSPAAALRVYQDLLERPDTGSDAALALDGAETLLDNGYPDHALPLILEARARARRSGDHATLQKAEYLLGNRQG